MSNIDKQRIAAVRLLEALPQSGALTVTIDLELAWGVWDKLTADELRMTETEERPVCAALIDLFDRYQVPATWAVVAALLDEKSSDSRPGSRPLRRLRAAQAGRTVRQVASRCEIGKMCSKRSRRTASRLSRLAETTSSALSHGQDPMLTLSPLTKSGFSHCLDHLPIDKMGQAVAASDAARCSELFGERALVRLQAAFSGGVRLEHGRCIFGRRSCRRSR